MFKVIIQNKFVRNLVHIVVFLFLLYLFHIDVEIFFGERRETPKGNQPKSVSAKSQYRRSRIAKKMAMPVPIFLEVGVFIFSVVECWVFSYNNPGRWNVFVSGVELLLVPNVPAGVGLQEEHFEPVFDDGSLCGAFFEEKSGLGVVYQVIDQMPRSECLIRYVGAGVGLGVHANWGRVYDDLVFPHELGSQVVVCEHAFPGCA